MTAAQRRNGVRRVAIAAAFALGASLSVAPAVSAQATIVAAGANAPRSIEDLTAEWASVERPLLGVEGLTDTQRDAIEQLEERYRKQFSDAAQPMREARQMLMRKGPFDRHGVERALVRMGELRKEQLSKLRTLLTEQQHPKYDANLKVLADEEAAAQATRDREAAFVTP